MEFKFSRVVIVGVGLMGGSFALALRRAGFTGEIIGVGRNPQHLQHALQQGVIDQIKPLLSAVQEADLILLAMPVAQTKALLQNITPHLQSTAVITDCGSTKQDVIVAAKKALGEKFNQFVAAHPIAGSEKSGVQAAQAELYQERYVILCPESDTLRTALQDVRQIWQICGAKIIEMSALQHDTIFATVSHLPHLLAFGYMNLILASDDSELKLKLAGSGFRDFTRIAGANPEMWADITCANRENLLKNINDYQLILQQLQRLIEQRDPEKLKEFFTSAYQARTQWKM